MKKLSVTHHTQLNPFVFPSETDIRFLLMVLAMAGSTMILTDAVVGIFTTSTLIQFLCALVVTLSLLVLTHNQARQSALKEITKKNWQIFPPKDVDPYLSASHQRMNLYIQQTVAKIPELASKNIQFIWDKKRASTGKAFGFGKHQYICLREGLHQAFIKDEKDNKDYEFPKFQAILMHELGHIANCDVSNIAFTKRLKIYFFPFAIISIIVFTSHTLWDFRNHSQQDIVSDSAQSGIQEIVHTNLKLIVLLLVVEIARRSILRVREYYADARAENWLGNSNQMQEVFSEEKQEKLTFWKLFQKWFQNNVVFVFNHPSHDQRIKRLEEPRNFFSPSYEVALLAGVLSGISLNANMAIFGILPEISNFTGRLNQSAQTASELNLPILLNSLLFLALIILFLAIVIGVFIIFGLIPIVGTVGLQIQQAAFADRAQPTQPNLLTLKTLIQLSLILGSSFILGCLLSPINHALSMRSAAGSISWIGIFWLAIGWSCIFFVWIVSISQLAGNLYLKHIDPNSPNQKRRWLTRLSGILLCPLFLWMCGMQVYFGAQAVDPTLSSMSNLIAGSIILGIVAFTLYRIIWTIGLRHGAAKGYFSKPHCPQCHSEVLNQSGLLKHCPQCNHPIAIWASLPKPISFPPLPPPVSVPDPINAPPL